MDKDGFFIKSEVKQSSIPGAGRGRFFSQSCKSGDIIRIQDVNSDLSHVPETLRMKTTIWSWIAQSVQRFRHWNGPYIRKQGPVFHQSFSTNNISFRTGPVKNWLTRHATYKQEKKCYKTTKNTRQLGGTKTTYIQTTKFPFAS